MGMNGVAFVGLVDLVDALTITPLTHPRGMNWQVASRGMHCEDSSRSW